MKFKLGEKLRDTGKLTYTRLRECFKGKLKAVGFSAEQFGLHSLRAGEPLQQLTMVYWTGCSRDMAVGNQNLQKMGT